MIHTRIYTSSKTLLLPAILFLSAIAAHAQQDTMSVTLDEISITATRSAIPAREATRSVHIVSPEELRIAPEAAVEDLLRLAAVVDIRRRGPLGAQADIGIRGAGFGQNLVLIDGMRSADPQTGHHALALAMRAGDIERIEILPGHMSALHGADAFGGLINIVTRSAAENALRVRAGGASFGGMDASLEWNARYQDWTSRTSLSYLRHDGYRPGTDFRMASFTQRSTYTLRRTELRLHAGYQDKDFGAFDFYTPGRGIPSREQIRGGTISLQSRTAFDGIVLQNGIAWRRLHDRFVFDSRTPDRFVNTHTTDVLTAEAAAFFDPLPRLQLTTGMSATADRIRSSALGDHERPGAALFTGARYRLTDMLTATTDLRFDSWTGHSPQWNPSFGLLATVSNALTVHASAGRSFRIPTYTDLYYSDPVNSGSPDVRPEQAWSAETGMRWIMTKHVFVTATMFHREMQDVIDYVLDSEDNRYYARNIHRAVSSGFDAQLAARAKTFPGGIRLAYQYLFSRLDDVGALKTRYALTHPRHKATALLHASPSEGTDVSLAILMSRPFAVGEGFATVDIRLRWDIVDELRMFAAAENLFDSYYEEIPGLPMPGRRLSLAAEFRLY
jgi:vitamin B12 transporter